MEISNANLDTATVQLNVSLLRATLFLNKEYRVLVGPSFCSIESPFYVNVNVPLQLVHYNHWDRQRYPNLVTNAFY